MMTGWRTRIFSSAVAVLGVVEMLDPGLIASALWLGQRGNAVLLITIAIATFILRQITTTPPGKK